MPRITDEEILDWWQAFDLGVPVYGIAMIFERPEATVRKHLAELELCAPGNVDPQLGRLLARIDAGRLTESERSLMRALAQLDPGPRGDGDDFEMRPGCGGGLPAGRVLQHAVPFSGPHVQSARQRRLDKMGSGVWANAIRGDLVAAGLMPRRFPVAGTRRWWT